MPERRRPVSRQLQRAARALSVSSGISYQNALNRLRSDEAAVQVQLADVCSLLRMSFNELTQPGRMLLISASRPTCVVVENPTCEACADQPVVISYLSAGSAAVAKQLWTRAKQEAFFAVAIVPSVRPEDPTEPRGTSALRNYADFHVAVDALGGLSAVKNRYGPIAA